MLPLPPQRGISIILMQPVSTAGGGIKGGGIKKQKIITYELFKKHIQQKRRKNSQL